MAISGKLALASGFCCSFKLPKLPKMLKMLNNSNLSKLKAQDAQGEQVGARRSPAPPMK